MDYSKATNEQLWTIMRSDAECPLHLLEGVFQEALKRDMILHFILSVIKKRYTTSEKAQEYLKLSHEDVIQEGYIGATTAIQEHIPGKGTFTNLLFIKISQVYGKIAERNMMQKRNGETCSYQDWLDGAGNTFEFYLLDQRTNVEKQVVTKVCVEQMLELVSKKQKEVLLQFIQGYTYEEIAKQLNTKKSTVSERIQNAFIKITGDRVNLKDYFPIERASYKNVG